MALLYGEGENAFIRLQEEIMRNSHDQSLFAWSFFPSYSYSDLEHLRVPDDNGRRKVAVLAEKGPLASSPGLFKGCGSMLPMQRGKPAPAYSKTNRGLDIQLPIIKTSYMLSLPDDQEKPLYISVSNCCDNEKPHERIAITLAETSLDGVFAHVSVEGPISTLLVPVELVAATGETRQIWIQTARPNWTRGRQYLTITIKTSSKFDELGFRLVRVSPEQHFNSEHQTLRLNPSAELPNESHAPPQLPTTKNLQSSLIVMQQAVFVFYSEPLRVIVSALVHIPVDYDRYSRAVWFRRKNFCGKEKDVDEIIQKHHLAEPLAFTGSHRPRDKVYYSPFWRRGITWGVSAEVVEDEFLDQKLFRVVFAAQQYYFDKGLRCHVPKE